MEDVLPSHGAFRCERQSSRFCVEGAASVPFTASPLGASCWPGVVFCDCPCDLLTSVCNAHGWGSHQRQLPICEWWTWLDGDRALATHRVFDAAFLISLSRRSFLRNGSVFREMTLRLIRFGRSPRTISVLLLKHILFCAVAYVVHASVHSTIQKDNKRRISPPHLASAPAPPFSFRSRRGLTFLRCAW